MVVRVIFVRSDYNPIVAYVWCAPRVELVEVRSVRLGCLLFLIKI
jgi:hypothetical protein